MSQANDPVNHPPHYTAHPSGVECITITEHFPFCVGNAIKYLWRAGLKDDAMQDLEKAKWYVEREIARRKQAATQCCESPNIINVSAGGADYAECASCGKAKYDEDDETTYNRNCTACGHTLFHAVTQSYGTKVYRCYNCGTEHMRHPVYGYGRMHYVKATTEDADSGPRNLPE